MDEPTAALTPREVERLFEILRELKGQGIGMIFVSHRLDEIFQISDRITVMRDGRTVITCKSSDLNKQKLIEQMVGRPLDKEFPKKSFVESDIRFVVRNLRGGIVDDVSFAAKRGEILGITGLMGAGRTEAARLIFGADRKVGGNVILDKKQLEIRSPHDAIRSGICLLTEDRKAHGLVLIASAKDNFAISNLRRWSRLGIIDRQKEMGRFHERVRNLKIRVASPEQPARDLSGGNQQKLLVARWLETDSQVIIFDEPTRGIDVGAKYEMYLLINELAAMGKVVIFISSELPEMIGMCDRILVMKNGRITGEIDDASQANQETIMGMAI
jgi:ABC-type sugar transport system ATPase subunit